jgi:hypothetical protein
MLFADPALCNINQLIMKINTCVKKAFLILFLVLLAACQREPSPAEQAVRQYLQALVDKNENELTSLICPSYETDALLELDSYGLFETRLNGVSCRESVNTGKEAQVVCEGNIEAAYPGEIINFDLSERTYSVIHEKGGWLVCGYAR